MSKWMAAAARWGILAMRLGFVLLLVWSAGPLVLSVVSHSGVGLFVIEVGVLLAMFAMSGASMAWTLYTARMSWVAYQEVRRLGLRRDWCVFDKNGWLGEQSGRAIRVSWDKRGLRVHVAHRTTARGTVDSHTGVERLPASLRDAPPLRAALAEAGHRGHRPELYVSDSGVLLQLLPHRASSYKGLRRLVDAVVAVAGHLDRAAPAPAGTELSTWSAAGAAWPSVVPWRGVVLQGGAFILILLGFGVVAVGGGLVTTAIAAVALMA